ncbi:MAG TPA: hypothetical protein VHG09_01150 [Longimicrobiales bacterium]|nr:hypothetical protein [Longimicrobiales bacterium]
MSHVDDGILHAYLDGALDALGDAGELPDGASAADVVAHLSSCADCRSRLEAERAIRESAGLVMLDLPRPSDALPEFAGAAAPQRRRRAGWIPVGWAASVILAIGAGWLGSDAWGPQGGGTTMDEPVSPKAAPPYPESGATEAAARDASLSAERGASLNAERDASLSAEREAPEAGVARADDQGAQRGASPEMPAGSSPETATGDVAASSPAEPRAADSVLNAAASPAPVASIPHADTVRALPFTRTFSPQVARTEEPPRAARSLVPMSSEVVSLSREKAGAIESWNGVVSAMAGIEAFDSVIARERSGELAFIDASSADVRRDSEPLFIIGGASEPSIAVARDAAHTVVRVRQKLSTGESVEILSWQPVALTADAAVVSGAASAESARTDEQRLMLVMRDSARPLPDGRHELVVRAMSIGAWVAIRGSLDENDLRALASRLTTR